MRPPGRVVNVGAGARIIEVVVPTVRRAVAVTIAAIKGKGAAGIDYPDIGRAIPVAAAVVAAVAGAVIVSAAGERERAHGEDGDVGDTHFIHLSDTRETGERTFREKTRSYS